MSSDLPGRPWVAHLLPTAVGACAIAWRSWSALLPGIGLIGGARSDGVRVSLADDCEGPLTDAEAALARRCLLATLAALEAGELSARLPGGEGTLLTIVVATDDVSACSAAVATVAGERALVDVGRGDLFVQVPRG